MHILLVITSTQLPILAVLLFSTLCLFLVAEAKDLYKVRRGLNLYALGRGGLPFPSKSRARHSSASDSSILSTSSYVNRSWASRKPRRKHSSRSNTARYVFVSLYVYTLALRVPTSLSPTALLFRHLATFVFSLFLSHLPSTTSPSAHPPSHRFLPSPPPPPYSWP